ncbi:pyridoxamine 5'-phosphate oxidase family protein [Granulicoccus phenolivorans]|uniref:pyridoxamine 5'-phosphate oxidase family protein n=1 Tax=Granulicoccus phenolivorans TaxID=266854 RepID=UPI00040E2161|nr:pyridoxamine 5'-phosphate oxidase family protein [Granulicoccus phenolivorans]
MELPETALAGALPAGVLPADDPLAGDPAFAELSVAECYRLLDTHQIGRVAWASRRGQLILPVAYIVCDGTIVFRTTATTILAELTHGARVAFEVDSMDLAGHTGWSVLVRGQAHAPRTPDRLVELWSKNLPQPWAPGPRSVVIEIEPAEITGRFVSELA